MPDSGRAGEPQRKDSAPENDCWMRLYEDHYEKVKQYFARRVKSPHDVEDLAQNVFTYLLGHCGHLSNPQVYMQIVARNELFAYWRSRKRNVTILFVVADPEGDFIVDAQCTGLESDPLEQLLREETAHAVKSMVAELTPALEEAMRLRFLQGLGIDEAAAQAGCSRETLKKRLKRARRSIIELHS